MGCNSNTITIPKGAKGDTGYNGNHGGISGRWKYSSTTTGTPASSEIRFNGSASSVVTSINISTIGLNSIDYSLLLANFAANGRLTIYKEFDNTKFWIGEITSITNNTTYYTIAVTYIMATDPLLPTNIYANGDNVVLTLSNDGVNGVNGTTVLSNQTTGSATTSGTTNTTLLSYTVPAAQLSTNESSLLIIGWVEKSLITDEFNLTVVINGTAYNTTLIPNGTLTGRARMSITRQSATAHFSEYVIITANTNNGIWGSYAGYSSGALTFANTITIDLKMQRTLGSGTATAKQLTVLHLKK